MPLLEIEQKFNFNMAKVALFMEKRGHPALRQVRSVNKLCFCDTYYDSQDKLSSNGLWVRKRQHIRVLPSGLPLRSCERQPYLLEWEAKQRIQGSSIIRSTFNETKDTKKILEMVRSIIPSSLGADANFGLGEMCQFETTRQTFLANDKFTIVLDCTDFGHDVGEVELLAEDAERAHREIDAFMKEYDWFFDKRNPKGKLTAYFEKFGFPKDGS